MTDINGYTVTGKIYESSKTVIYRGIRGLDNRPVVIKLFKNPYPSAEDLNQLEHEYQIGQGLDLTGVVKYYALENPGHNSALIMEDFGAISLSRCIRSRQIDLNNFFQIAIALAEIIGDIHRHSIIHKDINPHNILINPKTKEVKITDFSISTRIQQESQAALEPEMLHGTLHYMSPEQTGRVNRSVDYRSDFYSLGATYYEMLTGRRPFELNDPMSLVYAHIARRPTEPHKLNTAIPLAISGIIMKLLEKNPEDRYQSASGLQFDLEVCGRQLLTRGKIEDFIIGEQDISDRFLVPEKLYGRDKEISDLIMAVNRVVQGGKRLVLISGGAGMGKSALGNEIQRLLAGKQAYVISGKYEQSGPDIPLKGITQAFSALILHLLASRSAQIDEFKQEILGVVGRNGQVLIDMLPGIDLIIGEQPAIPGLPPAETQNRLDMVLRNFIRVFSSKEHPLILLLDDLQWADDASLELLGALFADAGLGHFLVVAAYREGGDGRIEKWRTTREDIGNNCQVIELPALNTQGIMELLSDTFHCRFRKCRALAELVQEKTNGNPFFIHEFLHKLHRERWVKFKNGWTWDISRLKQLDISDNVAVLMADKLKRLPPDTWALIKVAACLGMQFSFPMLATLAGKTLKEITRDLEPAMREGIILKIENQGRFSHTRVHESAYSLIDEKERIKQHYRIAQGMETPGEKAGDEDLFARINHFNQAVDLLNKEEKTRLARLNLEAGNKARATAAYTVAYRFFKQGIKLLPDPGKWEDDYELTAQLYTAGGETAFLSGMSKQAEKLFADVLQNAKFLLDRIRVYETRIHILIGAEKNLEALKLGWKALRLLGLHLPGRFLKARVSREFIEAFLRLRFRKGGVASLPGLPELTDPNKLAAARILTICIEPAYLTDPDLFPLLLLKLLNLTLKNGNSGYAAYAYAAYGAVSSDLLGNVHQGIQLGDLALDLLETFKAREIRAKVYFLYGNGINHWKSHIRNDLHYLQEAFRSGAETGDITYASHAMVNYLFRLFFMGKPLDEVKREFAYYMPLIKKFHQTGVIQRGDICQNLVLNLLGERQDPHWPTGEIGEEFAYILPWPEIKDKNRMGIYTLLRLIFLYLAGDFEMAIKVAREGRRYVEIIIADIYRGEFYFYYSLVLLARYPDVNPSEQRRYLKELKTLKKSLKRWAASARDNFQNKYLLIEALQHDRLKEWRDVPSLYLQAIDLSRQQEFFHEEAIASEWAALFFLGNGAEEIASFYMKKAHYLYRVWGVQVKIRELEGKYQASIGRYIPGYQEPDSPFQTTQSGSSSTSPSLDFNAIIKASQAISGEIVMENLLEKLVRIVMENAGAQKIVLLLKKGDRLFVEAESRSEDQEIKVFPGVPVEESSLPQSVIRFVERTKEPVVLGGLGQETAFDRDPYIQEKKPRSLFCLPLVHQHTLHAVLYLENRLVFGLFSEKQQETLKVLATQAAASLENALLYEELIQAEEKMRTILETTNEGFLELDNQGIIVRVNPGMCVVSGRTREDLVNRPFSDLLAPGDDHLSLSQLEIHRSLESRSHKLIFSRPDRSTVHCLVNITPLYDKNINKRGSFAMVTDLTEYERKDEQLRQAQKMETVGTLAGGLAHDFNNILGGIIGSLSLLDSEIKTGEATPEEIGKYLEDMSKSAARAKDIVKHLLALSRKEELTFDYVDLNATMRNVYNICSNTFEKGVDLNFLFYPEVAPVWADSTQLEQILLNLCVNAAHAMTIMKGEGQPWGGLLTVSLDRFEPDQAFMENHPEAGDTRYWKLFVQDDGIGMDAGTLARIFEPFFTTKQKARGSGLGLSMVYSIVSQHKGFIEAVSGPHRGSTFTVYLPESEKPAMPTEPAKEESILSGNGLILVVDDEPIMRKIAIRALQKAGYQVISADDGEKGVEVFKQHHHKLRLVLLDMQMPKKSGKETYQEMRAINADVKVLLTSGFRKDERVEEVLGMGGVDFLEKPYSFEQLTKAVHHILNP